MLAPLVKYISKTDQHVKEQWKNLVPKKIIEEIHIKNEPALWNNICEQAKRDLEQL